MEVLRGVAEKGYFRLNYCSKKLCRKIRVYSLAVFNDTTWISTMFQRHKIYTNVDERI